MTSERSTALALVVLALGAASAVAEARGPSTISWGSSLVDAPSRTLSAPVDTVYWQQALADGSPTVAPKAGQITRVTLVGRVVSGQATILFQDLRPLGGGRLRVISTTQPFRLSGGGAKRSFSPVNFYVQRGDHVGLATIGGSYEVFAATPGSRTDGLTRAGGDMNGSLLGGAITHGGLELLARFSERVG